MPERGLSRDGGGLVLDRLSKVFQQRGKPPVHAVVGIELAVADGELLGLLGPSGCGKSTTLRMIAGLEEPTAGDIRIAGRSIVALPPHERNVAVAFENYALFPPLTVEENIAFGMRARKEANPRQRARGRAAARHLIVARPQAGRPLQRAETASEPGEGDRA